MNAWFIVYLLDRSRKRDLEVKSELAAGDLTFIAVCCFAICLL